MLLFTVGKGFAMIGTRRKKNLLFPCAEFWSRAMRKSPRSGHWLFWKFPFRFRSLPFRSLYNAQNPHNAPNLPINLPIATSLELQYLFIYFFIIIIIIIYLYEENRTILNGCMARVQISLQNSWLQWFMCRCEVKSYNPTVRGLVTRSRSCFG